jgi:hypothetical protein
MATTEPGAVIGVLRLGLKSSLRMTNRKICPLHSVERRRELFIPKVPQVHVAALPGFCRRITLGPAVRIYLLNFPAAGLHLDYTRPNRNSSVLLGWGPANQCYVQS